MSMVILSGKNNAAKNSPAITSFAQQRISRLCVARLCGMEKTPGEQNC